MCVDKKCSADQSGRNNRPVQCPANCTNGGLCNNLGKCHCPNGFNPPFCQHFGLGGSEDGGPSLDPKGCRHFSQFFKRNFSLIFQIFFFCLISSSSSAVSNRIVRHIFSYRTHRWIPVLCFLHFSRRRTEDIPLQNHPQGRQRIRQQSETSAFDSIA